MTESAREAFWTDYQPGFRFTEADPGSREFYEAVERHRYELEPHIPEVVQFERWAGRDVLEAGCGIATDGLRFARAGARYTGVDGSPTAIELARRRFATFGVDGHFEQGSVADLPFDDESFDLVFSHGVIHHTAHTEAAVDEFHRVLRPGGTALVMLYHRDSFNHHVTIMGVRRALALPLLVPGAATLVARVTGEDPAVLEGHRELLRQHGLGYLTDRELFLSNNTDGPGNPLSKVYSRAEARLLFSRFADVQTAVRFLNLRAYPGGDALARTRAAHAVGRRAGWHLYVKATKAA
jgi:SAM-dependent methyltransferase